MFSRILLAIDGSECSHRAANYGLELAATYGAAVDALFVLPKGTSHGPDVESPSDPRIRGEDALDEVTERGSELGVDVETRLVEGVPSKTVVEHANELDADLVAMGQQGHTGLGERLLGSVLTRVLRHTDVPVLAVPDGGVDDASGYEDVLVPTDGKEGAEQAAPYGVDVARRYDATLHFLSVLDLQKEAGIFDAGGVSEEYVERLLEQTRENVDAFAESAGDLSDLTVVREIVRGRAHAGIREYVESEGIDLVVMASSNETSFTGQVLGSVTDRTLRVLSIPVLVVPVA